MKKNSGGQLAVLIAGLGWRGAAPPGTPMPPPDGRRGVGSAAFSLRELSSADVVDADVRCAGLLAEDARPVGQMREACPGCSQPLHLVLRHRSVTRTHLFCQRCSRCFDACLADGSSALRHATPAMRC